MNKIILSKIIQNRINLNKFKLKMTIKDKKNIMMIRTKIKNNKMKS